MPLTHQIGSKFSFTVSDPDPTRWDATALQWVMSHQLTGVRVVLKYAPGNGDVGQQQANGSILFERDETWSKANMTAGRWDLQLLEGSSPLRAALVAPSEAFVDVILPTGGDYTQGT